MALRAAVGQSFVTDGREAGAQAAQQALVQLGRARVAFAWVLVSYAYPIQQVLAGIGDMLGDIPLIGFSTSAEITAAGRSKRSVVVALLGGENVQGRAGWWPDFTPNNPACVQNMLKALQPDGESGEILLAAADGISGDATQLSEALAAAGYSMAGCLAGGEISQGRSYQAGGRQAGSGGLATMVLGGNIVAGVGLAHGWQQVGALSRITSAQGLWVRTIDEQPPSHLYARLFGYPADEWVRPPLNGLVRLYPLAVQEKEGMVVRSALKVEADGSLRMNCHIPQGAAVDLMVGSRAACLQAARQAAQQALASLGPTRPIMAVLLVDAAWLTLLEAQLEDEVSMVREVIGKDVPVVGAYTLGQLARLAPHGPVQIFNQHIEVLLFGDRLVNLPGNVTNAITGNPPIV
ncbi:MAG: FIST C-terminal domain-containing protein [Anaerolineales bacterium]|nr:FIST C-terminal domain-containing protein [Anaerolineales bacterium]